MKRVLTVLLLVGCLVVPVAANPIDDLYDWITGASPIDTTPYDIPIFTNHTREAPIGTITSANITGDKVSVSWQNPHPLAEDEQAGVITLFCGETSAWGGMANSYSGTWEFNLADIHRENIDGCHFDLVDGAGEML